MQKLIVEAKLITGLCSLCERRSKGKTGESRS